MYGCGNVPLCEIHKINRRHYSKGFTLNWSPCKGDREIEKCISYSQFSCPFSSRIRWKVKAKVICFKGQFDRTMSGLCHHLLGWLVLFSISIVLFLLQVPQYNNKTTTWDYLCDVKATVVSLWLKWEPCKATLILPNRVKDIDNADNDKCGYSI